MGLEILYKVSKYWSSSLKNATFYLDFPDPLCLFALSICIGSVLPIPAWVLLGISTGKKISGIEHRYFGPSSSLNRINESIIILSFSCRVSLNAQCRITNTTLVQNNKAAQWTFRRGNAVLSAASRSVWLSAWREKVLPPINLYVFELVFHFFMTCLFIFASWLIK